MATPHRFVISAVQQRFTEKSVEPHVKHWYVHERPSKTPRETILVFRTCSFTRAGIVALFRTIRRIRITGLNIDNTVPPVFDNRYDEDELAELNRVRSRALVENLARSRTLDRLALIGFPIHPDDNADFADAIARSNITKLTLDDACFDDAGWSAVLDAISVSNAKSVTLNLSLPRAFSSHPFRRPSRVEEVTLYFKSTAEFTSSKMHPVVCEMMTKGGLRRIDLFLPNGEEFDFAFRMDKLYPMLISAFVRSRTMESFYPDYFDPDAALELRGALAALERGTSPLCRLPQELKRWVYVFVVLRMLVDDVLAGDDVKCEV